MTQPEMQQPDSEISSGKIMSFFNWFYRGLKKGYSWFTLEKASLPEDEAGELMRRTLAQKSWFDTLTSGWVEQPFWIKCAVISGVTIIAGVIGLWFGISLLLMSLVGIAACGIHTLFVAHEHQRRHNAHMMAQEAIALNQDLKANQQVLDEVIVVVDHAADDLVTYSEAMKDNAHLLEEQAKQMKHQKELLAEHTEEVTQATKELVEAEKQAQECLELTVDSLHQLTEVVVETKGHVEGIGSAASKFTVAVDSIESSQQRYAEMVSQFGLFVQKQQTERENEGLVLQHSTSYYPFIDDLNAELDENDLLIEQMRQFMVSSPA